MKTVRTYQNINDALLDQSWLESNGIESLIPDEVTASSSLPHLSVYSGIRLQVKESDYEAALNLLPEETSPKETKKNEGNEKEKAPEIITLKWFKLTIGADLTLFILSILLGYIHMSQTPENILRYASDQYYSYELGMLSYYSYWPLVVPSIIASVGLLCRKAWSRFLYISVWVVGISSSLFSSAFFLYPSGAFLGSISTLLGGFVCCMIYFTNASEYFKKKGSEPAGIVNGGAAPRRD